MKRWRYAGIVSCTITTFLCVATLLAWLRGFSHCDAFLWGTKPTRAITFNDARIEYSLPVFQKKEPGLMWGTWPASRMQLYSYNFGFRLWRDEYGRIDLLSIPYWFVFCVTAAPITLIGMRRFARAIAARVTRRSGFEVLPLNGNSIPRR